MPDAEHTQETDRLLLDTMLGKLAVYLRMCGYDASYAGDRGVEADGAVRALAEAEGRLVVTRDAALAAAADGLRLTAREPARQLEELREAGFALALPDEPRRCGRCNGPLEPVPDGAPRPDYAPPPEEFDCWRCVDCGQHFWRGSHWDRLASLL